MDVMRDLVRRGVDQAEFLPRTDLEIREEEVVLVDNTDGVSIRMMIMIMIIKRVLRAGQTGGVGLPHLQHQ